MSVERDWVRLLDRLPGRCADLEVTRNRQDKISRGRTGGGSSVAPLPYRPDAGDLLDRIGSCLRGMIAAFGRSNGQSGFRYRSDAAAMARELRTGVVWIVAQPGADAWFGELWELDRAAAEVVDLPVEQFSLGECGARMPYGVSAAGELTAGGERCWSIVWAVEGEDWAECELCGARWNVAERRAAWVAAASAVPVPLAQAVDLLACKGVKIKHATARKWASRGVLQAAGVRDGGPVYRLSDVLDAASRPREKPGRKRAPA